MTVGFGTENLVFVPAGAELEIWDVYHWRRARLDMRRATVHLREDGRDRIIAELEKLEGGQEPAAPEHPFAKLTGRRGVGIDLDPLCQARAQAHPTDTDPGGLGLSWWVRLSDRPQESFHEDDYLEAADPPDMGVAYPVYGALELAGRRQPMEIALPGSGPDAPMWLVLPGDGVGFDEAVDARTPLPLVEEFCGAGGVSARGRSVNVRHDGTVAGEHMGAVPVRKLGGFFATAYFHLSMEVAHRVMLTVDGARRSSIEELLVRSRFARTAGRDGCEVFERDGDVIHVYDGLEGRESVGVPLMPSLVVAVRAQGSCDPEARSVLAAQVHQVIDG